MKKLKPNTILPDGAELIKPTKKKLGLWIEQTFDAKVVRDGLTWYRVKGGFDGGNNREDWLADVPGIFLSVHDYYWNGEEFGFDYGSFDNAVKAKTKQALGWAVCKLMEKRELVSILESSIGKLQKQVKQD